jgi:hypothetical protein
MWADCLTLVALHTDVPGSPSTLEAVRLASDAEDTRGGQGQDRGRGEPETTASFDREDLADCRPGLALDVASAHQARPEQVSDLLKPSKQAISTPYVLIKRS